MRRSRRAGSPSPRKARRGRKIVRAIFNIHRSERSERGRSEREQQFPRVGRQGPAQGGDRQKPRVSGDGVGGIAGEISTSSVFFPPESFSLGFLNSTL
jgi:hypothetical protein